MDGLNLQVNRSVDAPLLREQPLQPRDTLRERLVAERVREPQVSRRTERLTGHDGDLGLVEDEVGELERRRRRARRPIRDRAGR